jgi:hypothetical protein
MEPAVQRVIVFLPACGTHRESPHRGVRTVVRQTVEDGIPGSAVCTVDEWIPVAAVSGIPQLLQTVIAQGDIRQDQRGPGAGVHAVTDTKVGETGRIQVRTLAALDVRMRRMLALEAEEKLFKAIG